MQVGLWKYLIETDKLSIKYVVPIIKSYITIIIVVKIHANITFQNLIFNESFGESSIFNNFNFLWYIENITQAGFTTKNTIAIDIRLIVPVNDIDPRIAPKVTIIADCISISVGVSFSIIDSIIIRYKMNKAFSFVHFLGYNIEV